jgi:hypothetical protein
MYADTAETENEQVYPGQDKEKLIAKIRKNIKEDRKHLAAWRVEGRNNYDFFAGKQWSAEDKKRLEDQQRPPVTFNRVARVINAVAGLELQNRQEVRFIPRELSDVGVNEMLTHAAKWARDNCDAEDEESEAFNDALICGMGWTETRMDYEQDPEGMIIIERIDPFEMGYDCSSVKRNLADARWVWRAKEYDREEFNTLWPEHADLSGDPQLFWSDNEADPHDADNAPYYENDQSGKLSKAGKLTVIQYQWWECENFYKVQDINGQVIELSAEKFKKLEPMIKMMGARYVKQKRRKYRQMFLMGDTELETIDMQCNHLTFSCITGLRDRNNNTWFGLVALMRDPQMWANKWLSQILHIINTNAKGGVMAEQGAFANPRDAEEDWANADSIVWLNDGGLDKVITREAPRYPEGIDRLLQYAVGAINDVVGVSIEMLGMTDRDQPGYLEEMRKTSSISLLATFFSALRYYRKKQGRVLAEYIKNYISDGRLIRVVGEEGARYVPLIRDNMSYKYDIIVDDAPTSPNMKERVFNTIMQIMPVLLQANIPIPPDVVDYAPIPENLSQKWKKMLIPDPQKQQMTQMMEQIKMMLAQLELQGKSIENKKTESEVTKNYAQAQQYSAVGQDESAQAMQKMGMAKQEHSMKNEQMMMEQLRKDVEMLLNHQRKTKEIELKAQQPSRTV